MNIGDRVSTDRDGPGTVVDLMFGEHRSLKHGVVSSVVVDVDIAFDSGVPKFVLPHLVKLIEENE